MRQTTHLASFVLVAAAILALSATALNAQSVNDATGSMILNSVNGTAPNTLQVVPPTTINMEFSGNPNVPFILLHAPTISVGEQIFGPGLSLDIGPLAGASILANGISPSSFFDFFANTGPGSSVLSFVAPGNLPSGSIGALQAIFLDFTLPGMVKLSAATEIIVAQPCDYGTAHYGRGPSGSDVGGQLGDGATLSTTPSAVPSSNFDVETTYLARMDYLTSGTSAPGDIDRFRAPTVDHPIRDARNSSFMNIKTIHGNIYHYQDLTVTPNEFGYFMDPGNGMPAFDLPFTRMTNGTSTSTCYETEIAISWDSSTMAVVFDPASTNPTGTTDKVLLFRIDGGTFMANGQSMIDVTPAGANASILEESLTFSDGKLHFVDGTSTGVLYEVDIDPAGPATAVSIPPLGTGNIASLVDGEMYVHPGTRDIYFQAGASATEEDVFRIDNFTGLVTNISNFAVATEMEEFGDDFDGSNGLISVSDTGLTVAYCARISGSHELYIGSAFSAFTPIHVTEDVTYSIIFNSVVDINMVNDDDCLFFFGTGTTAMDLFRYQVSTGASANLTGTSGSVVAPFTGTPGMDPDGYINLNGQMIFGRDGTLSLGANAGASAGNLVAVDLATFAVTNITGDEFGGATTVNTNLSSPGGAEICLAANTDQVWFVGATVGATDHELWSFDASVPGAATMITSNLTGTGLDYDNLVIDAMGTTALVSVRLTGVSSGDEEIAMATLGGGISAPLTNDLNTLSDISDGSIRFLDPMAPCTGFIYAQGTNSSSNPTDAILQVYDLANGAGTVIDPTPGAYVIFGVGN